MKTQRTGYKYNVTKSATKILSILVVLTTAGCGSSDSSSDDPPPIQPAGLLSTVTDVVAFESSIKSALTQVSTAEQRAIAGVAMDSNFTGTYTQEANVDEFDAVRYNGEQLFIAPQRYFNCCFRLADAEEESGNPRVTVERSIRILTTDQANGTARLVSTIPLEKNISVQGMYLEGEQMFALTGQKVYGSYGRLWADTAIWAPEKLGFRIYDVGDISNPKLEIEASIDGVFVESRRIGNTVYIVSRYTPSLKGLHNRVVTAKQQVENQALLSSATLDDLLPKITIAGETSALFKPENCYVTTNDTSNYAVITSITAVPINNPTEFTTACYKEKAYGVYVSEQALYLTELRPNTAAQHDITRIHKFSLAGTRIYYRGSSDIEGTVWRGGQADFRMSEQDGDLRLLASQFDRNNEDFVDHQLYILRESSTRPDLDIVSTLPNNNRPQEIGKPNEALYGVRFLSDTVYAVTFERIDPLYAIDLSDPTDPFIAGELQVTGFSDFLHPVTDDLLLGLGADENGGVKLELFNVSNIARPLSRGSVLIGGPSSYSAARYDRHAFTYQANANSPDRFTVPASVFATDGSRQFLGSALYLFEILDKNTPMLATLNNVGSIQPPSIDPNALSWVTRSRSFIHEETVYYIRDNDVWSALWQSPTIVKGPF